MARLLRPLTGRADRTDFAAYVAALPPSNFKLGLTHVTTGYFMRDILDARKIAPTGPCPVLNQPLVYAFYGRPAYRNKADDTPSDLAYVFPAVLLLDPEKTPRAKHAFGFDTGAFMAGMMDDYVDPYMPLFDFHLPPDVQSAARLAQKFFGTPRDFLSNKPADAADVPPGEYEVVSYSKMVSSSGRGTNRLDDRISTPEFAFDERGDGCTGDNIAPGGFCPASIKLRK